MSTRPLPTRSRLLVVALAGSGVIHLARPQTFYSMVPRWLPSRRQVVYVSGVLELLCAAGMALPQTRGPAGRASAVLLAAVFVGNVQMAQDALAGDSGALKAAALARLPLQVPMIRAALDAAAAAG